nr:MAG TPA: minor tail protein [Caudoviricetes sp.]
MPGTYKYSMEIESNVKQLLSDMKEAQDRLDTLEGKEYKIKLNVDEKKLGNVISNLEKMLDSLGKGTGDFKQFENLSKELSSIVSEVQSLSKAFGKVDDSGTKTLLSSIQNIDKSLAELSQNILNVNKNMSNMGGNTSGTVKQVENISNAYQDAAKEAEKLADAQSKIRQKTNISLGDSSTTSANAEIKANSEVIASIEKKKQELASYEFKLEETRYEIEKLSKAENEAYGFKKAYSNMNDKYINSRKESLYNSIFGTDKSKGQGSMKYQTMNFGGNVEKGYAAWREELERLGYTLSELRKTNIGVEADIIPIDGRAITNAEEFRKVLFGITSVPSDNIKVLNQQISELESKISSLKSEISSLESVSNNPKKDAFPNANSTASVEKIADGFKEVKQNTEQATEATEKYQRVLSQVGEFGVDAKVSAMYQRNDGQLESVSWKAKRDDQGQILYDKNGNIDYDFNSTVISKYEQLEKIITTADNKLLDLQKSLKDTQNLNSNASTKNIEEQIQYQKDYIQLLEQTVKAISQQDEYLLYEQQIIDARAKAEKEYNLNQGTKSDISNAKQLASDEQKRQKSIEQTNRLLNKQQIIIDGIEKSYSKAANNDLDKAVNSQSDLAELEKKKNLIQFLLNGLKNEDRNSSNEKEFLQVEKLIAEYKQLAKDKLKANNSSKQELGGQELDVLLANQVTQYNKLISQSEKYGDATKEITNELKVQRDLIAEQDKNGVYVARSKKADGSEITANDYYNARDNYKISKSIFSSYETVRKEASELQAIAEAKKKSRQLDKEATQNSVDNALKDQLTAWKSILSIREKINSTSDVHEIEVLKQVKSEYQQNYIEADKILKTNSDLYDKETQLAKLEQIRIEVNNKITSSQEKQISSYENKLSTYQAKKDTYDATIARFNDGGWTSDTYLKNVQAVKDAVKKYEDLLSDIKAKGGIASEEDIQNLKEYESKIKDTIATVTNMSAAEKGYNFVSAQKELDKIHKLLNENSKMSSEAKNKIRAYYAEIESGNPSMSLDRIHGEIMKIYNAEVEAGRAGRSFFDTLKNSGFHQLAAQMAGMFGVYDVINLGKQAFSTVKELDYALVDLKKTTAMNSSELEQFYYDSNDVAKQMGVTTKEIIDQASSWSRLGYNSKQAATEMAKLSSQFALISPGMDTTTSQEGLVSIMKAWDIGYQDVKSQIMDDINALGNAMAEDNQDIVEGMERSAAALAAVGTSTKDAFALFSGIQEVLQNSEKSGTSLRSVALRLRSFDESTEEYSSDLANITGELADLTKTAEHAQGVSVFKPGSTTEFKSLVDYFREIADIWDEMSQKQQNDFLLKAFGRTQAQAGAALIQNFKGVEKALDVMDNAAGSADKEMETAKQSITYKLNELKQTWVGTVQDIANRKDLSLIMSGLIGVSKGLGFVIGKLGLIPSVIAPIAAILGKGKSTQRFCPIW